MDIEATTRNAKLNFVGYVLTWPQEETGKGMGSFQHSHPSLLFSRLVLSRLFSAGAYRTVYTAIIGSEPIVYKSFPIDAAFDYKDMEYMRMDSLVAERLSFSPYVVDIYGFCALGHIGEFMPHGELESVAEGGRIERHFDDREHLDPKNNLSPSQKLRYALEMAEPLRLMHGWPDGVMVHDDVQLSQVRNSTRLSTVLFLANFAPRELTPILLLWLFIVSFHGRWALEIERL